MFGASSISWTRYSDIVAASAVPGQDGHPLGVPGQVHRGLPGGVAAADDETVRPAMARASLTAAP